MKFLQHLQDINFEVTNLTLLDIAYVVVLLPLVVMLKIPMILFCLIVFTILIFKKTPASNKLVFLVFILGFFALYLSLYGAFSFTGLSRLKLFLELLVYILIIVVSMQRLTQQINFYLIISPFLFLALSLFFYHGIAMLVYVVIEVFVLLWMILAHRMQKDLWESFRSTMVMFIYSLPWVVMLFIFFPRISFEHASYGFKGEVVKRMGHDGTMYLDGNALLVPSQRIVMEVGFTGEVPDASKLYFRGSVLYIDKKNHWLPLPTYKKTDKQTYRKFDGQKTNYSVTLYPTQKRWLYMLDVPSEAIKNSKLNADLVSTVKLNIEEPIHYSASSYLSTKYYATLNKATYKASILVDKNRNPKTYMVAKEIKSKFKSKEKRASAIVSFFEKQLLTYTLKPDALNINHSTDSFLFDKRKGYCVHFASSFVTMARLAGINARIVTGYKADKSSSIKNYLAVREKDAHAWAELYIDKHWVRYETTATASNIDGLSQALLNGTQNNKRENVLLKNINMYLMYARYNIETWILYYSHIRQLQLLKYAKNNPKFVAIFVSSLALLLFASFMLVAYFKRNVYSSEALYIMQILFKKLNKNGFVKKDKESIHQFLLRYINKYELTEEQVDHIIQIDMLYEKMVYAEDDSKVNRAKLKSLVKSI